MKSFLHDISRVPAVRFTGKRNNFLYQQFLPSILSASLVIGALTGCMTYKIIDKAAASKLLIPAEGGCKGDLVRVWDKKGKLLIDKDGVGNFAVCAVTDIWLEPCCRSEKEGRGSQYSRCAKPERLKFADMSKLELWYPKLTQESRCVYYGDFAIGGKVI